MKKLMILVAVCAIALAFLPLSAMATEYKNASPAFSITYPDNYVKGNPTDATQVLAAKDPGGLPTFQVAVTDKGDMSLKDFAEKGYKPGLEKVGSDVEILSNEPAKTKDGSPAYRAEIEWMYGGATLLTTLLFVTEKDGKLIYIGIHTMGDLEKPDEIAKSLNLKP